MKQDALAVSVVIGGALGYGLLLVTAVTTGMWVLHQLLEVLS